MKLLIVALCLAVGPNLFIRSEDVDLAIPIEVNGIEKNIDLKAPPANYTDAFDKINTNDTAEALKPKNLADTPQKLNFNGTSETLEAANILDVLNNLNIGGRALLSGELLKFGDNNQFVASANDVLGEGGFGKVYRALNTLTGQYVAAKTELADQGFPTLPTEIQNYQRIGPHHGIPRIYYSGKTADGKSHVLVMQLLGKSIADLHGNFRNKFQPKTVYMIAIQVLYRMELVHRKRLVHRDIKPGNIAIDKSGELIYLFDFGISKKFVDEDGRHLLEGKRTSFGSGTPRFMSAYAHSHNIQSRRDDMESIGFMLMSFLMGELPWDRARGYDKPSYASEMVKIKEKLDLEKFCEGYAPQILQYFKYVRNLEFSAKPDYPYLRKLFRQALLDINEKEDYQFDWTTTR